MDISTSGDEVPLDHRVEPCRSASSRRPRPRTGDILVTEFTARADVRGLSIVPYEPEVVAARHDDVVAMARERARIRAVDAWLTWDCTHYARLASHRSSSSVASPRSAPECQTVDL